jgi:DNA-binding sugar fermentation-stimulating protein
MINNYAKVENHPNLIRDLKTNAIINTDKKSLLTYNKIKESKNTEKTRIDNLEKELSEIKSSILEIKKLLLKVNET